MGSCSESCVGSFLKGAMKFEAKKFRFREVVKHVLQTAAASVQNKRLDLQESVNDDVPPEVGALTFSSSRHHVLLSVSQNHAFVGWLDPFALLMDAVFLDSYFL